MWRETHNATHNTATPWHTTRESAAPPTSDVLPASSGQQLVACLSAIGAVAHGVKAGASAAASLSTASPVPGPRPDGPLADPHQLQLASRPGAVWFGPTRNPACAFPSMSLNRTVTLTRGNPRAGRLPTQMAAGRFRGDGVAQGGTTPRIRLCSMRPVKVS